MEESLNYFLKSEELINFAENIVRRGLKQAYLFSSADKEKNYAFCKILSMLVSCKNKNLCLQCDACQKILNNNSVDLFVYPKNNAIMVDDIKEIVDSSLILPLENEFKIYILNDFDSANIASQNKFLKTLEEPPRNVIFLLNTTKSDMVLDTIKSRCEKIVIPSFDENELKDLLEKNNIEQKSVILENCNNEFGQYVELLNKNFDETFEFCLNMLKNMKSSSDILTYSCQILKFKDLENFFIAMLKIFKDLQRSKIDENMIENKTKKAEILQISQDFSKKALDEIIKNLILANKELNFNTTVSLVIDCLLIDVLEEKHKWN